MKRHCIALTLHPFKNQLVSKQEARQHLNDFATQLVSMASAHPNLRINLIVSGSQLQLLDPLLLTKLNDFQKNNSLEWLTTGYTEPFWSFSPLWLSAANLQHGIEIFQELVGYTPKGYVAPFSNWEPSAVSSLVEQSMNYVVLHRGLLSAYAQYHCGYWMTEHNGASIAVFPAFTFHHYNCPANIMDSLESVIANSAHSSTLKCITLKYLYPLVPIQNVNPMRWLQLFVDSLSAISAKYQLCLLHEMLELSMPVGMQYIAPNLTIPHRQDGTGFFPNYFFTFDVFGILQRRILEIAEHMRGKMHLKESLQLKRQLFSIQDINRLLPQQNSGFTQLSDRSWSFNQVITLERECVKRDSNQTSGQVRITDFMKNGTKSLIMSNKALKIYVDYKNGGHIYEIDYRDRNINLLTGYNPSQHLVPRIIEPGKSPAAFVDFILNQDCSYEAFRHDSSKLSGDFTSGRFEYKIKKTAPSVRAILNHQGSIMINDKLYPLMMEKVFGLDKEKSELLFTYQLSNHSLSTYAFKFACCITLALPGVQTKQAELSTRTSKFSQFSTESVFYDKITHLIISDNSLGYRLHLMTQQEISIWCFPLADAQNYQGTTLVLTVPVSLKENSAWNLNGKLVFKKIRMGNERIDVI